MTSPERLLRLLLVDDHDLYRLGMTKLLNDEAGLLVASGARSGEEAIRRAEAVHPDVVLLDLGLSGITGIEAAREIRARCPRTAVVVLTASDDPQDALAAVTAGAVGYVLKDDPIADVVAAVHAAAAGHALVTPRVAAGLLDHLRRRSPRTGARDVALNEREREVLAMLVRGCENAEIADELHLSPSTIKQHVTTIIRKLEVENRTQAAVAAVRRGLA